MRSCLGCLGILMLVGLIATLIGAVTNGDGGTALFMVVLLALVIGVGVYRGLKA